MSATSQVHPLPTRLFPPLHNRNKAPRRLHKSFASELMEQASGFPRTWDTQQVMCHHLHRKHSGHRKGVNTTNNERSTSQEVHMKASSPPTGIDTGSVSSSCACWSRNVACYAHRCGRVRCKCAHACGGSCSKLARTRGEKSSSVKPRTMMSSGTVIGVASRPASAYNAVAGTVPNVTSCRTGSIL